MARRLFVVLFFFTMVKSLWSQELLCNVQVQAKEIAGVDKTVFTEMKTAVFEFMNNRRWSNLNYLLSERIECTLIFTITGATQGGDEFNGTLNIVLQRPIYGTDYNSVVLNMIDDKVRFSYVPSQTMEYADNTFTNNLTSLLAFYAYILIGLDQDTYSLYGGTPMYEKALTVVNSAQSTRFTGWEAFESNKNRYHFAENLLNSAYQSLRKFLYEYHRKGLDTMSKDVGGGRTVIAKSLPYLQEVFNKRPGLYLLQLMIEAKRDEIINIFSEASPAEKIEMINIMSGIDPSNGSKYERVTKR
ncbi:MAG: DUF4835 family protein [Bacteroidales bacterium]|nr:DUF4835 family protein [Bacteroidales bacterium]